VHDRKGGRYAQGARNMNRWGERWTTAEVAELRELAACGYSQAEAAAELGRTVKAIRRYVNRWGCVGFRAGLKADGAKRAAVLAAIGGGCRSAPEAAVAVGAGLRAVQAMILKLKLLGLVESSANKRRPSLRLSRKWGQ
jgi:hypothetical protein